MELATAVCAPVGPGPAVGRVEVPESGVVVTPAAPMEGGWSDPNATVKQAKLDGGNNNGSAAATAATSQLPPEREVPVKRVNACQVCNSVQLCDLKAK